MNFWLCAWNRQSQHIYLDYSDSWYYGLEDVCEELDLYQRDNGENMNLESFYIESISWIGLPKDYDECKRDFYREELKKRGAKFL